MNAFLQSLRYYFDLLLNSPHHLMVYIAAAAVLLICIPILRLIFGSPRRKESSTVEAAYPSMLGLTSSPVDGIDVRPRIDFSPQLTPIPAKGVASIPAPVPPKTVTSIKETLTEPCIHCGANMSSHRDFCPSCGYAQPMKQSFTA